MRHSLVDWVGDLLAIMCALPAVELGRRRMGLGPLILKVRERGRNAHRRCQAGRARLRRIVRWVDQVIPGSPNCYRRVLLQIGSDAGFAEQPVHLGLMAHGAPRSGHIWLADEPQNPSVRYDAQIVL